MGYSVGVPGVKATIVLSPLSFGPIPEARNSRPSLGRLMSLKFREKAPAARLLRRPLNSHNHNQRDRRRRFYLAVHTERLTFAPRYDISLRRNRAANIRVSHCRTVVRPLQRMRLERDADDNRTALITPSNARFTDLGMLVSLLTSSNNGVMTDAAAHRIRAISCHLTIHHRKIGLSFLNLSTRRKSSG